MLHDEIEYPEPEIFRPERYIYDNKLEMGPETLQISSLGLDGG